MKPYFMGRRLMMATIHDGFLWTCQTVGLSGTNGTYTGDASGTNVDRSAIQWLAFEISSNSSSLTLPARGEFSTVLHSIRVGLRPIADLLFKLPSLPQSFLAVLVD